MMILNTTNRAGQLKGKFGILQRQRLAWLAERPKMVAMLPSDSQDVDREGRAKLDWVLSIMRAEGLYSRTTPDDGCRDAIRRLVGEIRRVQS